MLQKTLNNMLQNKTHFIERLKSSVRVLHIPPYHTRILIQVSSIENI